MCGIFGIFGHPEAGNLTYLGLHALQHRGQESAGIVTSDGRSLYAHRAIGLVQEIFSQPTLAKLPGHMAIGHVRYSTAGGSGLRNAQPIAIDYARGSLAVAHNGNLTNADELREQLESRGSIFQTSADTENVVHLIAHSLQRSFEDRVVDALSQVRGAYSVAFLSHDRLVAVRDPRGIRPLVLGRMKQGGAPVVASEPCAFDLIDAELVREVEPGEMLVISESGVRSSFPFPVAAKKACVFEYVYFARPDSRVGESSSVYEIRKRTGQMLAREHPVPCDVVIPVPDSGVPAAVGYAKEAGVPFEMGFIRSHYVGRTFIEPQQSIRHFGVRLKLNPVASVLRGKRVVVIDDSIVRGTTSRKIVKMLRDAGATEVHVRISSPPVKWPCFYGIDTPTRQELIASSHTTEEIARYLTADSLGYLSLEGMVDAVSAAVGKGTREDFCHACFSGEYSIPFTPPPPHKQLRLIGV